MIKRLRASLVAGGILALLLLGAPRAVRAGKNEVALAVIVSRSSTLTDLSLTELRSAFRAEKPSEGQPRLIALNHPPKTQDRVGFDRIVLGMDPEAVGRFWIARKVEGGAGPPRTIASLSTLRRVVEKLSGAIGYLRPGQLSSHVRAIRIDGKLPEDPGYPLRYVP